jgi:hypothetical protein
MIRPSKRMKQKIADTPRAFRKFGEAFFDLDGRSGDGLERLLRDFSHHERRSLKTFLDEFLGPDYSDEDIELIWSKIPGYDAWADRCFISTASGISSTRGLLQAVRRELG